MLSVLIPVKDWNPYSLVESLSAQLVACGHPFEILVSDDGSDAETAGLSGRVSQLQGVTYYCRKAPLGRSANRNFLADQAGYPYLLFIDGDAGITSDIFISQYIRMLDPDTVLCGGTLYLDEPPENPDFLLRWKYGITREQADAAQRQKCPWKSFSTFNFLIPAGVFKSIRFEESINGYGHEDTLFGINLHRAGVKILHINNGLVHSGLEPSGVYLEKIRESGSTLYDLYMAKILPAEYVGDIRLLSAWYRLKKLHLSWLPARWFRYRRKSMEKRLSGKNPSMLLLDLYKLGSISHFG